MPHDLHTDAWRRLADAVTSAAHPFHLGTLATVDADLCPQIRTVVLRDADEPLRRLCVHTDRRSPKFAELLARPAASMLFYDRAARVQLRLSGTVTLHTDDALADARWAASRHSSRLCYLAPLGSSTPVPAPPPAPDAEDDAPGRANFAVLALHVSALEHLHLAHTGHQRLRLTYPDLASTWLTP